MDYKTVIGWAKNIKADCKRKGLTEQQTRDRIYNAALMVFSDDDDTVTPEAVEKAKRVLGAVMPGVTSPALMVATTPPDSV
jgi:predicted alpha/beta hydrolase family esterase